MSSACAALLRAMDSEMEGMVHAFYQIYSTFKSECTRGCKKPEFNAVCERLRSIKGSMSRSIVQIITMTSTISYSANRLKINMDGCLDRFVSYVFNYAAIHLQSSLIEVRKKVDRFRSYAQELINGSSELTNTNKLNVQSCCSYQSSYEDSVSEIIRDEPSSADIAHLMLESTPHSVGNEVPRKSGRDPFDLIDTDRSIEKALRADDQGFQSHRSEHDSINVEIASADGEEMIAHDTAIRRRWTVVPRADREAEASADDYQPEGYIMMSSKQLRHDFEAAYERDLIYFFRDKNEKPAVPASTKVAAVVNETLMGDGMEATLSKKTMIKQPVQTMPSVTHEEYLAENEADTIGTRRPLQTSNRVVSKSDDGHNRSDDEKHRYLRNSNYDTEGKGLFGQNLTTPIDAVSRPFKQQEKELLSDQRWALNNKKRKHKRSTRTSSSRRVFPHEETIHRLTRPKEAKKRERHLNKSRGPDPTAADRSNWNWVNRYLRQSNAPDGINDDAVRINISVSSCRYAVTENDTNEASLDGSTTELRKYMDDIAHLVKHVPQIPGVRRFRQLELHAEYLSCVEGLKQAALQLSELIAQTEKAFIDVNDRYLFSRGNPKMKTFDERFFGAHEETRKDARHIKVCTQFGDMQELLSDVVNNAKILRHDIGMAIGRYVRYPTSNSQLELERTTVRKLKKFKAHEIERVSKLCRNIINHCARCDETGCRPTSHRSNAVSPTSMMFSASLSLSSNWKCLNSPVKVMKSLLEMKMSKSKSAVTTYQQYAINNNILPAVIEPEPAKGPVLCEEIDLAFAEFVPKQFEDYNSISYHLYNKKLESKRDDKDTNGLR